MQWEFRRNCFPQRVLKKGRNPWPTQWKMPLGSVCRKNIKRRSGIPLSLYVTQLWVRPSSLAMRELSRSLRHSLVRIAQRGEPGSTKTRWADNTGSFPEVQPELECKWDLREPANHAERRQDSNHVANRSAKCPTLFERGIVWL